MIGKKLKLLFFLPEHFPHASLYISKKYIFIANFEI